MARTIAGIDIEMTASGNGPPLLFLHGGDHFAQNRACLDRLAEHFRVIVPRHPGFGNAARPAWFRSVADIAYLYLDLLDAEGLDGVTLVGSSFGGWLALEIAVRSTARLRRLVLIDALGVKFSGREERDIADIYALPADELLRRSFADPARGPDYDSYDEAALETVARDRAAVALYGWRPYMHNPSLLHWLHRVRLPTLVLWGASDRIALPAYGERLAAAIPGARFRAIGDAGHYPQIEQPDAVAAAIADFTREQAR